jgi:phosphinothricin acetyltransferase
VEPSISARMAGSPLMSTRVRAAQPADLATVAAIYNEGIAERQATFETRPREAAELASWLEGTLPFLVVADGSDHVVGFARVGPYSPREAYRGVGEHAVYVAAAARGQGLGRTLLEALAAASEEAGLYKLTSRVFVSNTASRAAHRAAGFEEIGVQRRHGRLDRSWRDCVLVERLLGTAAEPGDVVHP